MAFSHILRGALVALLLSCSAVSAAPLTDLCLTPKLEISPTGKYIYFSRQNGQLFIAEWDCVMRAATMQADCPIAGVPEDSADGTYFFSPDDAVLYEVSGTGRVAKVELENLLHDSHYLDDRGAPPVVPADDEPIAAYFTIDPGTSNAEAFVASAREDMRDVWRFHQNNPSLNARDIFGAIKGDRRIFLIRKNSMDMYFYDGESEARLFDILGHAYDSPRENITFKMDDQNVYALVSGSVLKIGRDGRLQNYTESMSRVSMVNGRTSLAYRGFYTQDRLYVNDASALARRSVRASFDKAAGTYKTGVSVGVRSDRSIVSTLQSAPAPGMRFTDRQIYAHRLAGEGLEKQISCMPANLHYSERFVGSPKLLHSGIWLQSYAVSGNNRKLLYIPGGPFGYQDPSQSKAIVFFLSEGYDVDVVNYGGSAFTYDQAGRLNTQGYNSVISDAKNIERVLAGERYDGALLESFGGSFYRFLSPGALSRVPAIILYEPAGSAVPDFNRGSQRTESLMLKVYGADLAWKYDTKYYQDLKACQVTSRTLLIMGDADTNVNPAFDYRHCWSDPSLTVLRHTGGHSDNVTANLQAALSFLNTGAKN